MEILKTSHGGFSQISIRKDTYYCLNVSFYCLFPTVIRVSLHARVPGGSWDRRFFVPAKLHQPNPLIRICSTGKRTNCCNRLPVVFKAAYGNEQQGPHLSFSVLISMFAPPSWPVARLPGSCWPPWCWTPSSTKPCSTVYMGTPTWLVISPSPCASSRRPSTHTPPILSTVWSCDTRWGS